MDREYNKSFQFTLTLITSAFVATSLMTYFDLWSLI